jgi:hypothetical protein
MGYNSNKTSGNGAPQNISQARKSHQLTLESQGGPGQRVNYNASNLITNISQKKSLLRKQSSRGSHASLFKTNQRVSENSKLEMWSSKSGLEINGNGPAMGNEIKVKRSEVSFGFRVMVEAAEKLNNDLKICN